MICVLRKELECITCGLIQTIQRRNSKDRAKGHIKHLWCPQCLKKTPHMECEEFAQQFEKNMVEMTVKESL